MPAFSFKPEYFQIYLGEDRVLPLRIINIDGTPFSLDGATEIEARFKKSDGGVLSKRITTGSTPAVTKFTFSLLGSAYNVIGSALAIQLYNYPSIGHYFWFNVTDGTNNQIDPFLSGISHQVDILTADTAAQIATKFYTVIASVVAAFSATNLVANEVIVTNVTPGAVINASSPGTAALVTIQSQGTNSGITIINSVLGKISVKLPAPDSSTLLIGERQNFVVIVTLPTGIRKINYRTALTVDRQAV